MPSIVTRIVTRTLHALFPRTPSVTVIRPAASLSEARRLAADMVASGSRVLIQPAARGFDVVEVAA